MTHLVIQLKKESEGGFRETVSPDVIRKLYDYAHSLGLIYQSTDIKGDLLVDRTYLNYIDYLAGQNGQNPNAKYPGLDILATSLYLYFEDPVLEAGLINSGIGDGVGITSLDAQLTTTISSRLFKNNTRVVSFNELSNFGVRGLNIEIFYGATSLVSIDTSKITSFGESCLRNTAISSIDLSSATSIGRAAFMDCSNLSSITFPNQPFTMESDVFRNCSSIQSLDFSNCTSNELGMMTGCSNLLSVTLSSNIKKISNWAFADTTSLLTSINLENVTLIGTDGFKGCTGLTSVDLSSCTSLSSLAFLNCTSLRSVIFGTSVTIYDSVFSGCSSLLSITGTNYITILGTENSPLDGCSSLSINNPDFSNVTLVGNFVFRGCSGLTGTLTLGTLTTIRLTGQMFKGCSGLTKIIIGSIDNLSTTNSNWANGSLSNCTNLKIVDIGNISKLYLTRNSLINTENDFKAFVFRQTTPPEIDISGDSTALGGVMKWRCFVYDGTNLNGSIQTPTVNLDAKIYVPKSALTVYKTATHWSDIAGYIYSIEDDYNEAALLA